MGKFITPVVSLMLAAMTFSCVRDSRDDCDPVVVVPEGGLRLELQWVQTEPQSPEDSIRVAITGTAGYNALINTDVDGKDLELPDGMYRFIGNELAENIILDTTSVAVRKTIDGTAAEPTEFAAGMVEAEVLGGDGEQVIYLPMHRQTRELVIHVQFTGAGSGLIDATVGSMDGIAISRHIDNGFPPVAGTLRPPCYEAGTISYLFQPATSTWYTGVNTLIGIDGPGKQYLHLRVMFTGENFTDIRLDITEMVDGFHTEDVESPWQIYLSLNVGATFEMEIEDWLAGADITLDAN